MTDSSAFTEAQALYSEGRFAESASRCRAYLSTAPGDAAAVRLYARIAESMGMSSEAIVVYQRLLELLPEDNDALNAIAWHQHQNGDLKLAVDSAKKALAASPRSPLTLLTSGTVFLAAGDPERGESLLRQAVAAGASSLRVNEVLTQHYLTLGEFDKALMLSRETIKAYPDSALGYLSLARAKRFHEEDEDARKLRTLIEQDGSLRAPFANSPRDRAQALGALYKMASDLGRHQAAWDYLEEIKKPLRLAAAADVIGLNGALYGRVTSVFTSRFMEESRRTGSAATDPIFVVGLPRSGTTLLERLISASPRVVAAGERTEIEDIRKVLCARLGSDEQDIDALTKAAPGSWNSAAAEYLMRVRRNISPSEFFVDKMPGNFVNLGFIRCLFPRAKIIHMHRHPVANCFSLYEQDFGARLQYNLDQQTLGRYYLQYRDLMEYWRQNLPGGFLEISYEDLVADFPSTARCVSDYLEIELSPDALEASQTSGAVRTASQFQVRQPIYTTSLHKWRDYKSYLTPLMEVLKPTLDEA
ncbi:MAG: sulfotransferase [Pseudomonadota bacterium]